MKWSNFHEKSYLFLGFVLLIFSILDMFIKQSIVSYLFTLSFYSFTYFVLFEESKSDDERMKVLQNKAAYHTVLILFLSIFILYLISQLTTIKIDYLFTIYSILVISYTMNLLILSKKN
ncbi:hypothetical protein AMS59_13605 [Lysinibacillus sp. FJAT-14745]|nr:hypothetical protein AMS59_13605 [Lysinibacillus sp. FJAT-14745]